MRKYLFIYFILQLGITNAQNLEITVLNRSSQPVPYAYILINGVATEITDTLGKTKIPLQKLKENDTISISYLGAAPATTVFDKSLRESKKYCFVLDESSYNLDEVVITYSDIERLFKRSCDYLPPLNYNCILKSNFDAIFYSGNKTKNISGQLEAENEIFSQDFVPYQKGWFHLPIVFKTENDTVGITRQLAMHTHIILDLINKSIGLSQYQLINRTKFKPEFNYLGEKDGYKVFRLTYRTSDGGCFQNILYLDKKTKTINSAEIDFAKPIASSNYLYNYNIKFDCRVFTHKRPMRNPVYVPENINYAFKYGDWQADLRIYNISIKYRKPDK